VKIKDEKEFYDWYNVQSDEYGKAIFHFAYQWAELMEYLMDEGYEFEEIVEIASSVVDETYCISGFMYGCAVNTLSVCWEHGEELRIWHNLKYQIGNEGERANEEGGVLNPAVLNLR
jgi:hypothetical protein